MKAKHFYIVLILSILLNISCEGQNKKKQNLEIFNTVWSTINSEFFDPEFNGLNWQDQYELYKPIIQKCESKDSLYHYLNQMLFKLNVSHLFALPPTSEDEIGSPQLFFDGTTGIDLRLINGEAIITSVKNNSTGDKAKLIPGLQILSLNGKSINSFIQAKKMEPLPPFNDIHVRMLSTENMTREIYGNPNDTVTVKYVDSDRSIKTISLVLKDRTAEKNNFIPELPPIYASVDFKMIRSDIAYLHFDVFMPMILDEVVNIINEHNKVPNMIIDLRGNPGGDFNTRKTIASQFVNKRTLFWKYQRRNDVNDVYLEPPAKPYTGNLVILIDELSSSSSEEFSGAMKAIDRATIIGQRTAGKVLTMEISQFPDGGIFVYPNQQTRTSKNEILEGVGVIPNITIELNKNDLLRGIDTQLKRAIEYIYTNE